MVLIILYLFYLVIKDTSIITKKEPERNIKFVIFEGRFRDDKTTIKNDKTTISND